MGSSGRLAVIDIGSNSVRLVVIQRRKGGSLEILADSRAALRLVQSIDARGRLRKEAIERTVASLLDFKAIAEGIGVEKTLAVATAAVRLSRNAREFVLRIRETTGLRVEVISSEREARYAFLGAVRALPVESGYLIDIGGGSIQLTHFRKRKMKRSWSLPVGALSLTDRYVKQDPPGRGEVRKIRRTVRAELGRLAIPRLRADEVLLGTGGTIRNVAKIDHRMRSYPIHRLHGYLLGARSVREIAGLMTGLRMGQRAAVPGLNSDRADSIVGGAIALEALIEHLRARELTVAGLGVREGLLFESLGDPPEPSAVRRAAAAALGARFSSWNADAARRRQALAEGLWRALVPNGREEVREALGHAAMVLDIGRSIDFYERYVHTARILVATDLIGFSHRGLALTSAITYLADDAERSIKVYRPLLETKDRKPIERAATILVLAEEIEHRIPRGRSATLRCTIGAKLARIEAPIDAPVRARRIAGRFRRAFARNLIVLPGKV
jgi:exopolyphosphatase/guanosine-5'-triphosphate,3'-diphosphate pyrophosphatase